MRPSLRPLLRPKMLAAHAVVLALAVAFVGLGRWQLGRLDERRAFNHRVTSRSALPEQPLPELVPALPLGDDQAKGLAYRRARARGRYDLRGEIVLLSRSRDGLSGHHLLTPLVDERGNVLLVERGWVPLDLGRPGVPEARPPEGLVEVHGLLLPSQARGRFGPRIPDDGPVRQLYRVEIPRLQRQIARPVYPLFLLLERQEPPQTGDLPKRVARPRLEEGPHLSYALQWFAFALIGLIGYAAVLRRRLRTDRTLQEP